MSRPLHTVAQRIAKNNGWGNIAAPVKPVKPVKPVGVAGRSPLTGMPLSQGQDFLDTGGKMAGPLTDESQGKSAWKWSTGQRFSYNTGYAKVHGGTVDAQGNYHPPAAPAPAAPAAPASPDPRDSTYWSGMTGVTKARDEGLASVEQARQIAAIDFQRALRGLASDRVGALEGANSNANRQGLFFSGQLSKARTGVETDFNNRQANAQSGYDTGQGLLTDRASGINSDYSTGESTLFGSAVDRQLTRDQSAPDPVTPDPSAHVNTGVAKVVGKRVDPQLKTWKTVVKGGRVWHYYTDGRKINVRAAA